MLRTPHNVGTATRIHRDGHVDGMPDDTEIMTADRMVSDPTAPRQHPLPTFRTPIEHDSSNRPLASSIDRRVVGTRRRRTQLNSTSETTVTPSNRDL
ncbi:MAG: hypothetical protein QM679_09540 [Patulibacter sp.]